MLLLSFVSLDVLPILRHTYFPPALRVCLSNHLSPEIKSWDLRNLFLQSHLEKKWSKPKGREAAFLRDENGWWRKNRNRSSHISCVWHIVQSSIGQWGHLIWLSCWELTSVTSSNMVLSSSRLCLDEMEKTRMNAWPLEMESRCIAGNWCDPVVSVICKVHIDLLDEIT